MEQSPEVDKIILALVDAQLVGRVALEKEENTHLRTKYADLIEVMNVTQPILTEHGLVLSQWPGAVTMLGDKTFNVELTNFLIHKSGQWIREKMGIVMPEPIIGKISGGAVTNAAQRQGSAYSYARRYAWLAIFGIATGDDDDAQRAFPRESAPIEEQVVDEGWFAMLQSGSWRKGMGPNNKPLGALEPQELRKLIAANASQGGANNFLTAATAAALESALVKRHLSFAQGIGEAKWTGKTILEQMTAKEILGLYNSITTLPVPQEQEPVETADA